MRKSKSQERKTIPHTLLKAGMPVEKIRKFLGHKKATTAKQYSAITK
jgi:hypothetical protein